MKPQDNAAAEIEFGVEIETQIPVVSGIDVGNYHHGLPVFSGQRSSGGIATARIDAPEFNGNRWMAERDGSIQCDPGYIACEFVSPILKGEAGVAKLREMITFLNRIGAKVNRSCGLHVTIGIKSAIKTVETVKVAEFLQKLAFVGNHNAWAIYAQTGTDRHLNNYAHQLRNETEAHVEAMAQTTDCVRLQSLAAQCGRGMINFQKAFRGDNSVVEFRAFAGTLNLSKILHHLATAFGIVRRAVTTQTWGSFNRKVSKKHTKITNAVEAIRRMWRILGWVDAAPGRECALGLFGTLYNEFSTYRKAALKMAEKFEAAYPNANL